MCFHKILLLIMIIILAVTCGSILWDWINDREHEPLLCKISKYFKYNIPHDKSLVDPWIEFLLTIVVLLILELCLAIWFITVPIAVIIGGAYYTRYYMRQKKKE